MQKYIGLIVLVVSIILDLCDAGTIAFQHRDTSLADLKSIDSYVASALPVLQDGFFIGTSRGPILVKSQPSPGDNRNARPVVRSKYYNTLPRLIPAGFEGVAISHFNLGAASPIQPFSLSKHLQNVPATQPQQYASTQIAQPSEHYVAQPQQIYLSQQQASQYAAQQQQQQQQYFSQEEQQQQQQQYIPQEEQQQQQQQYISQEEQQQQQQYVPQPEQYAPLPRQYISQDPQQQQHQLLQSAQSQQELVRFGHPQQYAGPPSQIISDQSEGRQIPQESAQISERIQSPSSSDPQPSFQDDNLLRPEQEQVTAYQTQIFGAERFQSQKLVPNSAVIETTEFEQTLPETLRNQFYKNANLATILAQESLPVQGEQIIAEWDTNKIAKGKIHALLRGAGLI